jgi:hypothetical protein
MVSDEDQEINHRDFTTVLKDGMYKVEQIENKDGKPVSQYIIDAKSAWYKTHFINSFRFGMMGEYLEEFGSYIDTVKYHMSEPMAKVLEVQLQGMYDVMRHAVDAKSSETMSDKNNKQTALGDKYLNNKQERLIDIKGEIGKSLSDSIMGKEAHDGVR